MKKPPPRPTCETCIHAIERRSSNVPFSLLCLRFPREEKVTKAHGCSEHPDFKKFAKREARK